MVFSQEDKAVIKNDFLRKSGQRIEAVTLSERLGRDSRLLKGEKDFVLEVPQNPQNSQVYGYESKSKIDNASLFHQTIKQSKKVMVLACVTWNGATKPFFINDKEMKVNSKLYKKHLDIES